MPLSLTTVSLILAIGIMMAPFVEAAESCNVGVLAGECISTSSCSANGGKSTPGYCPGPTNIQCCTYGSCRVGSTNGKCQPTSSCTGTSTPGLCPGPTHIQCCTSGGGSNPPSGGCPPNVNAATVALVKEFEGFVPSPEPDPIGLPTVGYGHLCQQTNCAEVPFDFPLSESEAAQLMQRDMKTYTSCLRSVINVSLNDNQYGALASWTFNVGCGNMRSSTLVRRLNNGESPNTVAAQELPKWNKAGGQVLPGLTRRRNAEVELFRTASSRTAIPC